MFFSQLTVIKGKLSVTLCTHMAAVIVCLEYDKNISVKLQGVSLERQNFPVCVDLYLLFHFSV